MGRKQWFSLSLLSNLYLPSLLSFSQSPTLLLSVMGIQFSKRAATGGGTSGFVSACQVDPEIQTIDSLNEVAGSRFDMNQDVIHVILESKRLVDDYFENSIRTSDFFTALENSIRTSLKKARDSQLIGELAIKAIGDPFIDEFYKAFKSVYQQQSLMHKKLQNRKVELDRKLESVDIRRKVTRIIFISAFVALLICSVVAAIVAPPRIAATLTAAASIPLISMKKWLDSKWKDSQDALNAENELINTMHAKTSDVLNDLNSIINLVNPLEIVFKDEYVVRLGIEETRKKMRVLMKNIENLVQLIDQCSKV